MPEGFAKLALQNETVSLRSSRKWVQCHCFCRSYPVWTQAVVHVQFSHVLHSNTRIETENVQTSLSPFTLLTWCEILRKGKYLILRIEMCFECSHEQECPISLTSRQTGELFSWKKSLWPLVPKGVWAWEKANKCICKMKAGALQRRVCPSLVHLFLRALGFRWKVSVNNICFGGK